MLYITHTPSPHTQRLKDVHETPNVFTVFHLLALYSSQRQFTLNGTWQKKIVCFKSKRSSKIELVSQIVKPTIPHNVNCFLLNIKNEAVPNMIFVTLFYVYFDKCNGFSFHGIKNVSALQSTTTNILQFKIAEFLFSLWHFSSFVIM